MRTTDWRMVAVYALALCLPMRVGAETVVGAGSSAAALVYKTWAAEYERSGGDGLRYDPVGSSAGMAKIRQREVDFGASDVIDAKDKLDRDGLVMFPTVVTAVVPVVNLPKLRPAQLKLTGEVLAGIYLGQITQWDAPELRALNPDVSLPALPIRVVVRSDGSGTTWNFAAYLARVSPAWKARYGVAAKYDWPKDFMAVKGSGEVSKAVRATAGAIGYIDYNYVVDDGLISTQMRNHDGAYVSPTTESFRSAVVNSAWFSAGDFTASLSNLPGSGTWPMTMGTFVAVPRQAKDAQRGTRALRFFVWSYLRGDDLARKAKAVPLPDKVQANVYRELSNVVDAENRSIGAAVLSNLLKP